MSKGIGVHTSHPMSYVDHLVPLCHILGIPFFCTNEAIATAVELFYPELPLILDAPVDCSLDERLQTYDTLVYVDHFRRGEGFQFFEYLCRKNLRSVCALHGNSDKKRNIYWIEHFADEDVVLLYGQHMIDFAKEKGILERIPHLIRCGNYRLEYYLANKAFLDAAAAPFLFPSDFSKKTVLYAPTWTAPNRKTDWRCDYSSFFEAYTSVVEALPEDFRLYVKVHPYLTYLYPDEVAEIVERYQERPEIRFVNDLPLIYPLLETVDAYVGDYSSIGYDFLHFNRPLFFLNADRRKAEEDKGVFLYHCGETIEPEDFHRLYRKIGDTKEEKHAEVRHETYNYAFGERKPLTTLRTEIEEALR